MRDSVSFHSSVLISFVPGVMMIVLILLFFFFLGSHRMQKGMGFVLYWIGFVAEPLSFAVVFGLWSEQCVLYLCDQLEATVTVTVVYMGIYHL